jgi:hypothetical protein
MVNPRSLVPEHVFRNSRTSHVPWTLGGKIPILIFIGFIGELYLGTNITANVFIQAVEFAFIVGKISKNIFNHHYSSL